MESLFEPIRKRKIVFIFFAHGESLPPPSVQSRFHENRRRGHEEASWRWQQLEITWHIIGKHIRVTGSRPVSFLPDSSSAFDKHRPREEYPLWFATFTRLFTNGLVTRRSAPPPHPTPRPTLSLPGAKRSPPPPPPGIPRGESERAGIEPRRNRAVASRVIVLLEDFLPRIDDRLFAACSQQLYLFLVFSSRLLILIFFFFFDFPRSWWNRKYEVFFFFLNVKKLFAPLFEDEKSEYRKIRTIFIVSRYYNWR